jgi:hypothetical protein
MTKGKDPKGVMHNSDGVGLREHFEDILCEIDKRYEQRFCAQEQAVKAALNSAQMAVDKAEVNVKAWQAASNEWRGAMTDKEKLQVSRNEWALTHSNLEKRVNELESYKDTMTGKADQASVSKANLFAGIAVGISILSFIIQTLLSFVRK